MANTINKINYRLPSSDTYNRAAILAYSGICYAVGFSSLMLLILATAGLLPLGNMVAIPGSTLAAVMINIALLLLFGLQHSIMARPAYKRWSERYLNPALERSNFVLMSGLALIVVVACWQPIEGLAWQASGTTSLVVWLGFIFGWGYLFAATFAINHFDLFGLRQAWFAFQGRAYEPVVFKENWMYRFSRHPIMVGVLIGMWCVPTMTGSKLMLALGMSLYIAVGLYFEERDLIRQWGKQYVDYRKRVGALFTLPK